MDELEYAAKCTAFVIIELPATSPTGQPVRHFGTAYFISKKLLLTAGHNTLGPHGVLSQVRVTYPGTPYIDYQGLNPMKTTIPTIDCKVVGTLYTGKNGDPFSIDIAILDAGSHNAAFHLDLSANAPPPTSNVNVIGYPGVATQQWLGSHEGIADVNASRTAAEILFPPQRLTITSGIVEKTGTTISYNLSTMPGMSGGCVLYNGTAVGRDPNRHYCLQIRGSCRTRNRNSEWPSHHQKRYFPNGSIVFRNSCPQFFLQTQNFPRSLKCVL
jgi:hypothetical protein